MKNWKKYKDTEYQVSENGDVIKYINKNHPERNNFKIIKPFTDKDGYLRIQLTINNKSKKFYVHRLVYEIFVGKIIDGLVCCHRDGVRKNNNYLNIIQLTQKENIGHKKLHGTWQEGEKHPRAILTNETAIKIKTMLNVCQRTSSGRVKKGEIDKICNELNVSKSSVYGISGGSYACV